jgi:cell division protein FtsN
MAQDFAKQRPPQPQPVRKNGKPTSRPQQKKSAHWNWFFSGIIAGSLLTGAGYIGFLRYQAMNPAALDADNGAQTPVALPDFDFGFYNELATAEVTVSVPPDPATAATTGQSTPAAVPATQPAAVAQQASVNYLLQAGSFQAKQEADERRAKITLMNMAAEIVPGVVAGRTWYRVQVGPFAGRDSAEAARKELSASNIDSIPLLMR